MNELRTTTKSVAIHDLKALGFMTGSTLFFGKGDDIDYVVPHSQIPDDLKEILDGFESSGSVVRSSGMQCYKLRDDGNLYNFIVVNDELYPLWELATESAMSCIRNVPAFKEWFGMKHNRQVFFAAMIDHRKKKMTRFDPF